MFTKGNDGWLERMTGIDYSFLQREQLAANTALASLISQHRNSESTTGEENVLAVMSEDPDVNVVDMDDETEGEDNQSHQQSTNESNSTADQR